MVCIYVSCLNFNFCLITFNANSQEKYPTVGGKVTGMLLEMDNAEILHLDRELLSSRVEEAVAVLQMHQTKQPTAQSN